MISVLENMWRHCAQTLQFQIVVKTATVFVIVMTNNSFEILVSKAYQGAEKALQGAKKALQGAKKAL